MGRCHVLIWLRRTFGSSIGSKALMACTGLVLIGFLFAHLGGNLLLFADADGAAFDAYATALEHSPLLPLAEAGLALLFCAHIVLGVRVQRANREARETAYRVRRTHGARTPGSRTMVATGLVILLFLVAHLYDFRLCRPEGDSLALIVRERLASPSGLVLYGAGVLALGLHLTHALRSALHTLGLHHPRYEALVDRASFLLGFVLGLAFLSFPLVFFLGGAA
ncbi:MAG: succinate dehydrogenase [Planctomycetes bacterium]|jgi:succinate dehydrogenase / fumarate reductase cytochrome b subunit|nr:succinate dehydrogenase [Planctomycetota bacterium]MDP6410578.1 succinate dehydrogenase cytochrome b subunit [Planctomycetota bacterium]